MASALLPQAALQRPSADPGGPGAGEEQRRSPIGRPLGAGGFGALCLSCPSVLENADTDPVPAPQLLRQSRLFMNEARAGEGGLVLLRQSVG